LEAQDCLLVLLAARGHDERADKGPDAGLRDGLVLDLLGEGVPVLTRHVLHQANDSPPYENQAHVPIFPTKKSTLETTTYKSQEKFIVRQMAQTCQFLKIYL